MNAQDAARILTEKLKILFPTEPREGTAEDPYTARVKGWKPRPDDAAQINEAVGVLVATATATEEALKNLTERVAKLERPAPSGQPGPFGRDP